jgi:hypothetical protein
MPRRKSDLGGDGNNVERDPRECLLATSVPMLTMMRGGSVTGIYRRNRARKSRGFRISCGVFSES